MEIKNLLILLLVLALKNIALSQEGPQSGGGGGTVNINGTFEVTDFYNFTNVSAVQNIVHSRHSTFMQNINVDNPNMLSVRALFILQSWFLPTDLENSTSVNLRSGFFIDFKFTNDVESMASVYRPKGLGLQTDIAPTAYYYYGGQVFINRQIWHNMNYVNRLALVLHERLRHLQITLGYIVSEEFLQKATITLLACRPDSKFVQNILYSNSNYHKQKIEDLNRYANACLPGAAQIIK